MMDTSLGFVSQLHVYPEGEKEIHVLDPYCRCMPLVSLSGDLGEEVALFQHRPLGALVATGFEAYGWEHPLI